MCVDFFDHDWVHQPFHEPADTPFASIKPEKPLCFEDMWDAARVLARDKAFSRIDFYQVRNRIYFGEITFYPTTGMGGFSPAKYDELFGQMITLPDKSIN